MLTLDAGMRVGGRELTRQLRGNNGRQVFSAVELADHRETIVKLASLNCRSDVERLQREFAVLRDAAGPGVVPVLEYTVSLSQGAAWLVLPAQGQSLASILAASEGQRLAPELALAAIFAAAASLGELHARGWRHGDVKPGNLLCNADGSVLLTDMEFALRFDDKSFDHLFELRRSGTPPFMAPELWQADVPAISSATDIWALGVSLYLCLFGDYPFGHSVSDVAAAIERGLPPTIAELPRPVRDILAALLSTNPAERPQNGSEAARLIATMAKHFEIDLAEASRELGRLATGAPVQAAPSEAPTMFGPSTPPPGSAPSSLDIASVMCAAPPPGSVPVPQPSRAEVSKSAPGGAESSAESLLDRIQEFLDIASDIAPAPAAQSSPAMPGPAPLMQPAPLDPTTVIGLPSAPAPPQPQRLVRRAAARWYRRMNPEQNFPLSIVFSGKQIRIVGGSGLGVTLGQREIVLDADDPVLDVEPWFPGCLVSPPRADVHVTEENTVCRFWITPLAHGELNEACVTIRYRGRVVETLLTPTRVVTRTLAKVLGTLGVVAPLGGKFLGYLGWEPETVISQSLPRAGAILENLGPIGCSLCVAGLLTTAAIVHLYVTRPLLSDEPEPRLLPQPA